jgi:hypothetical protein
LVLKSVDWQQMGVQLLVQVLFNSCAAEWHHVFGLGFA